MVAPPEARPEAPPEARPVAPPSAHDAWFEELRAREFSRLDREGLTYVDFTGSPPFAASLLEADATRLRGVVHGNPHSRSAPSQRSTDDLLAARAAILDFLHADPDEYAVALTANASAACRLVGEAFPFRAGSRFVLAADDHNSVNGIREFARARGGSVEVLPLDDRLRLAAPDDPGARGRTFEAIVEAAPPTAPSLFAYPAQSNFSGVRHPLDLVARARAAGWRVLLDAAAFLPTADLDLRVVKPDFLCLSVYKISGYPTGVGALVARHAALADLARPSFTGGTVRWVSVANDRHLMAEGAERF
jgi:selenocysteine lyase/cysteine desulfurase